MARLIDILTSDTLEPTRFWAVYAVPDNSGMFHQDSAAILDGLLLFRDSIDLPAKLYDTTSYLKHNRDFYTAKGIDYHTWALNDIADRNYDLSFRQLLRHSH